MDNMNEISLDEAERAVGGAGGSGDMPIGELRGLISRAKSLKMTKTETIAWLIRDYGNKYDSSSITRQVNLLWDAVPG